MITTTNRYEKVLKSGNEIMFCAQLYVNMQFIKMPKQPNSCVFQYIFDNMYD